MERKKKGKAAYMISVVAENYDIHPQTLRLYERERLLKPSRSEGNMRLYTEEDLERLELILGLTRDLGVNLAGVEVILNMREKMDQMQREFNRFFEYLREYAVQDAAQQDPNAREALVPSRRAVVIRSTSKRGSTES